MHIVRTQDEIDEVLNWAADATMQGTSNYPGMTYEQGLDDFWRWLTDKNESAPNAG